MGAGISFQYGRHCGVAMGMPIFPRRDENSDESGGHVIHVICQVIKETGVT